MTDQILLWNELEDAYARFIENKKSFLELREKFKNQMNTAEELHKGTPGIARELALENAQSMSIEEKKYITPDLVALASYGHGFTEVSRQIILSLPHDWLLENIPKFADPILENGDYEEYSSILSLYNQIDSKMAIALAKRGKNNTSQDIQEVCIDFLENQTKE